MTAVGSPQQAAEKLAADITALAHRLDVLRDRPDWRHDDVVDPAVQALYHAARSTASQRAKRRTAADEAREDDLVRAHAARSPYRTPESDRRTGGPAAVAKKARAAKKTSAKKG